MCAVREGQGEGDMNLTLQLSPELEAKLRERALAAGKPIDDLVLHAVEQLLEANSLPSQTPTNGGDEDPFLGLLSDRPELADSIAESAMHTRETRPLRVRGE